MKIFKISREGQEHDAYFGHIIVANTEKEVREEARNEAADEGQFVWDTAEVLILGTYAGQETEPFIVLSDYEVGY